MLQHHLQTHLYAIDCFFLAIGLCLLAAQIGTQTSVSENLSLKQRMHNGEGLKIVEVPTDADREKVLAMIKEEKLHSVAPH